MHNAPEHTPQLRFDPTPITPLVEAHSAEDLAAKAAAGSSPSFCRLVAMYEARLFNFLLRRVGSTQDAEDLTQETFIRAWKKIKRYDPQWRFSTWLFTIGARLAANHLRAKARRVVRESREPVADASQDPANAAAAHDEASQLWAVAHKTLSPDQYAAVWLHYVEQMSTEEISHILDKSASTIRVMLFRARGSLAKSLGQQPAPAPCQTNNGRIIKQQIVGGGV